MKTIFVLSTTILLVFSLNANAAGKSSDLSNDIPKSVVSVAPFVWGNPDEQAPEDLRYVKARFAKVPRAPFVWGNPEERAPELLKYIKAESAKVPVAPFVWGNPEEAAPEFPKNATIEL